MYIATIPNRNSPPAILLRMGYRKDGKVKTVTLANLTDWPVERVEALRRAFRGDFDGCLGDIDPVSDRVFGVLYALNELAKRCGVSKALGKSTMAKLVLFLILARIADQGSRLSSVRWAQDHCVSEILGLTDVDLKDLYCAMDWAEEQQDGIEKQLFRTYTCGSGAPQALVLYDVTSSYLEGEHNELGEYGFNRDKKKGKKQIVIGLLTAADGEPLAVRVFKGNSNDTTTVSDQINILKTRFGIQEVVFVGDRGMVKSKAKKELGENGFRYITALTKPQITKLVRRGVFQPDLFDEKVCEVQHGRVRLVLRKNEAVRLRASKRRDDKLRRLNELKEKRNEFVWASERAIPEAGLRTLRNWAKRHKLSQFVTLSLKDREIVSAIDETAKTNAALLDGCYALETDVSKELLDAETVDARYRSLQQVERDFRTLKTAFLEIRPIFVRKKGRTRAHAFIAMLALKIVREAERCLKAAFRAGPSGAYELTLKDALSSLSRICFLRYQVKGAELLRLPALDEQQLAICKALSIEPPIIKAASRPLAVAVSAK
jgi:transposase